ncbi:hypothetical protein SDC9_128863 [bioreactor metagenome]|uniref:Uncharacterized protein n=1 Tax=bioreactor metagenome TaxID=1076179 RepID=A0A645CXF4_9ZZZZ
MAAAAANAVLSVLLAFNADMPGFFTEAFSDLLLFSGLMCLRGLFLLFDLFSESDLCSALLSSGSEISFAAAFLPEYAVSRSYTAAVSVLRTAFEAASGITSDFFRFMTSDMSMFSSNLS